MVARAYTVAFQGVEARPVEVQCALSPGLPAFSIVGLPDKAVSEARDRVRAALGAMSIALPSRRITVNLSPADLPKEGSHFDLPIALALLAALDIIPKDTAESVVALGELSLDGTLVPVIGALPAAMAAAADDRTLLCPAASGAEAAWVSATKVIAAPDLGAAVRHFTGQSLIEPSTPGEVTPDAPLKDMRDVKGQERAKRALEIAAAGGHNLLMVGPPGSGKSMLAQRLPSILPALSPRELLEVSMIASIAGELSGGKLSDRRPFRAPHHSASMAAMVGGGIRARPGEVSLAHRGVLFLDEFPEFSPVVLDSLRQPLESGESVIARANHRVSYPARMQLIAAMNPCRCGMAGEPGHVCARGARCAADYQARISGPLLDRIDLRIDVPAVTAADLIRPQTGETSETVRTRVVEARRMQAERYTALGFPPETNNAQCSSALVETVAAPDEGGSRLLSDAAEKMKFSARAYHRILKVARSLADLDGSDQVRRIHLAEAISYRVAGERMPAAA